MRATNKGSALLYTLLLMAIIIAFSGPLITTLYTEMRASFYHKDRAQAYYYARTGAEMALGFVNSDLSEILYIYGDLESQSSNSFAVGATVDGDYPIIASIEKKEDRIEIRSQGRAQRIMERVEITIPFLLSLPETEDPIELFPVDTDDWRAGTDEEGGTGWVEVLGGGKGRIRSDNSPYPGDPKECAVIFPDGITVEHQEGQQEFSFYAPYLLFENTPISLEIKSGNTLHLYSQFLLFYGQVIFDQPGGHKHSQLTLNILRESDESCGEGLQDVEQGLVYFYHDVVWNRGNTTETIIESGAYYFQDGTLIDSSPQVTPPLQRAATGSSDNGSSIIWQ